MKVELKNRARVELSKSDLGKLRFGVELNKHSKVKTKIKSYKIQKFTKEGSLVSWGVSKKGFRFYNKKISTKDINKIDKEFNFIKSKKDNKSKTSIKVFKYHGRYNKRRNTVRGERTSYLIFNVGKKRKFFTKEIVKLTQKGKLKDVEIRKVHFQNTNSDDIINQLLLEEEFIEGSD